MLALRRLPPAGKAQPAGRFPAPRPPGNDLTPVPSWGEARRRDLSSESVPAHKTAGSRNDAFLRQDPEAPARHHPPVLLETATLRPETIEVQPSRANRQRLRPPRYTGPLRGGLATTALPRSPDAGGGFPLPRSSTRLRARRPPRGGHRARSPEKRNHFVGLEQNPAYREERPPRPAFHSAQSRLRSPDTTRGEDLIPAPTRWRQAGEPRRTCHGTTPGTTSSTTGHCQQLGATSSRR